MEVTLYGAAKTVTGSCYSIQTNTDKLLIDCGMFQGGKKIEKLNYDDLPVDTKTCGSLLLTHAHLDHCGRIPKLIKSGFCGKIYATSATIDLAKVVMQDAAKIALHDIEYENKKRARQGLPPREPIYTKADVDNALKKVVVVKYEKKVKITNNIAVTFHEAGHILGAASISVEVTENNKTKTLVFSGDIGQQGTPIVKPLEYVQKADYVFIESTYGDRLHPPIVKRKHEFLRIIQETYNRGGKLLIPSFAIERAQELLYNLNEFAERGLLPKDLRVVIDSPMASTATKVFVKHPHYYNKELKSILDNGDNPFNFPNLEFTKTVLDSKRLNDVTGPIIIIAGSGMCTAGRIKHHIKNHIEDAKNTILFVGYQAQGTLGSWIKKGEKNIRLLGCERTVNAKVETIDSFSGHADYRGLLHWAKYFSPKPKKIFVCHGEEKSAISLSKKIEEYGIKTYIPSMGEKLIL